MWSLMMDCVNLLEEQGQKAKNTKNIKKISNSTIILKYLVVRIDTYGYFLKSVLLDQSWILAQMIYSLKHKKDALMTC